MFERERRAEIRRTTACLLTESAALRNDTRRRIAQSRPLMASVALEMSALDRLRAIRERSVCGDDGRGLLDHLLEAVMTLTAADRGNIQLLNPRTEALEIVAHRGFDSEFLEFFGEVHDAGTACGVAMRQRECVIVEDVAAHPIFAGRAREVMLRAGARAVQSTPLVAPSGGLLGVVSTHYGRSCRVPGRALALVRLLGRHAGAVIAESRLSRVRREDALDDLGWVEAAQGGHQAARGPAHGHERDARGGDGA